MDQLDLFQHAQRWNLRRASYRPAGEVIDTSRYSVEVIDGATAKPYVVKHHYSRSYPAGRCRIGLFRKMPFYASQLVGVAVFSVSAQKRAMPAYFGEVEDGIELGRFVLADDVEGMGETWFLGRAFRLLRREKPLVEAVLSYSDPIPRTTLDGTIIKPGHLGGIYLAHNAVYFGRSKADRLLVAPDGRVASRRSLSKIRNGESGWRGACEALREMGAPERWLGESGEGYHHRVLNSGVFRVMPHPGNHVWGWGLSKRLRQWVHQRPWRRQSEITT